MISDISVKNVNMSWGAAVYHAVHISCVACLLISVQAGMLDSSSSSSITFQTVSIAIRGFSVSVRCTAMLTEAGHDPWLVEL